MEEPPEHYVTYTAHVYMHTPEGAGWSHIFGIHLAYFPTPATSLLFRASDHRQ